MTSNELRQKFLDYFKNLNHEVVSSSSLIPGNDPTLLFTNAGMVQFKDVFLGHETRAYRRAVTAQRCVRAGGKHNDLENVGYTARHHTFFEMLGNFSFGDYFKREAIKYAWNFLTQELKIPPEKLWVTVYEKDDETADIWLNEIKVDPKRFSRCGEKDNFWSMGETGPCGPCTEIFYDHGPEIPGGPPGSKEEDGDRFVEIWNLVFMQYNRSADGTLTPLPKPSVDTGMGLERTTAVLQGVHNNYDIDLFRHLIDAILKLVTLEDRENTSLRVIADHIRSTSFLITDGVVPANEGRGYVLRRIIRRAIRHGHKLGLREAFFYKLVAPLVEQMGAAYPELTKAQSRIEKVLLREEEQFANTLDQGLKLLEQELTQISDKRIPGDVIFKLYDTYGFPPDLTADIAREKDLIMDYAGFEQQMAKQRAKSQEASRFAMDVSDVLQIEGETDFTGHESLSDSGMVMALFSDNQPQQSLTKGQQGIVVLDCTPFYAEAGGQIGDSGQLFFEGGNFKVTDTKKKGLIHLHHGYVASGTLHVGMGVNAEVDSARTATMLNHTATHLLHAALRRILGEHVIQKGSLVAPDRLRFDFAHYEPMTQEQIKAVELLVNQQIQANLTAHIDFMTPKEAVEQGALALFGEKYGEQVRVLSIGEFSMELCGGTHVKHTGEIGFFKIISETGIAAGIRRIEALTSEKAIAWVMENEAMLHEMMQLLKSNRETVMEKLQQILESNRTLEKEVEGLQVKVLQQQTNDLLAAVKKIDGINVLASKFNITDAKLLREAVDQLKAKLQSGVVLLAAVSENHVVLNAGVTKDLVKQIHAGDLVNYIATQIGGKGGGRPDMAQGGGNQVENLDKALKSIPDWISAQIFAKKTIDLKE